MGLQQTCPEKSQPTQKVRAEDRQNSNLILPVAAAARRSVPGLMSSMTKMRFGPGIVQVIEGIGANPERSV
jgi:hypothetical protein